MVNLIDKVNLHLNLFISLSASPHIIVKDPTNYAKILVARNQIRDIIQC